MTNVFESYERHLEKVAKANQLNKPIVFDALTAAGVTRVTVEFDGVGDSGQIDEITAYAREARIELPSTTLTLHQATRNKGDPKTAEETLPDAIKILCYDYLSQTHDGWENNDGAYGTFEFYVGKQSIYLDFNERFTDATHHFHDF